MDVTIKDIAADAGVSVSTVSRVVNGSKSVSPELKGRVMAAIRHRCCRSICQSSARRPALRFYLHDRQHAADAGCCRASRRYAGRHGRTPCRRQDSESRRFRN